MIVQKPWGIATHGHGQTPAFVEYLQNRLKTGPLFPVQRLDQETSGLLVMPCSSASAASWTKIFQNRQIEKTYLFWTDRQASKRQLESKIDIENKDSETHFSLFKEHGNFQLWKAFPKTGRKHQIRKHASHLGIPILGDTLYGGSLFGRICLHASELKTSDHEFKSVMPMSMQLDQWNSQDLSKISQVSRFLAHAERSICLVPEPVRRLVHKVNSINVDQYNDVLWFYDFNEDSTNQDLHTLFQPLLQVSGSKYWVHQRMANRGQAQMPPLQHSDGCPSVWSVQENQNQFLIHRNRGHSPGLFLDQRNVRSWVQQFSKDKTVLNLFCYSGGFSVQALKGDAAKVESVDILKSVTQWTIENLLTNGLIADQQERHQVWTSDVFYFLDKAISKQRKFDLILCDPPSFSRGDKKTKPFRLEQDWKSLLAQCHKILSKNGILYFSNNLESWKWETFKKEMQSFAKDEYVSVSFPQLWNWDFELPPKPSPLKYCFFSRSDLSNFVL